MRLGFSLEEFIIGLITFTFSLVIVSVVTWTMLHWLVSLPVAIAIIVGLSLATSIKRKPQ